MTVWHQWQTWRLFLSPPKHSYGIRISDIRKRERERKNIGEKMTRNISQKLTLLLKRARQLESYKILIKWIYLQNIWAQLLQYCNLCRRLREREGERERKKEKERERQSEREGKREREKKKENIMLRRKKFIYEHIL